MNVFTACELRRLFFSFSSSLAGCLSADFSLAADLFDFGGSLGEGLVKLAGADGAVRGVAIDFERSLAAGCLAGGMASAGAGVVAACLALVSGKSGKLELELSEFVMMGEDGFSDGFFIESLAAGGATGCLEPAGKLSASLVSKFKRASALLLVADAVAVAAFC